MIYRNYDIADVDSLPSALKNLIELFGSEPMFTILGSLTGLTSENDEDEETSYEPSPKKQKSTLVGRILHFHFSRKLFSFLQLLLLPLLHHRILLPLHRDGILN
jgi:hypothetical protein